MHRRISNLAVVLSLSFCAAPLVCAPLSVSAQTPTQFAGGSPATGGTLASDPTGKPVKIKTINFHVRNDSATPLVIQAGDQQMTIKPGETLALKLQEGASVTTVSGTVHIAPGAVLTTVTRQLQDNTLAVS